MVEGWAVLQGMAPLTLPTHHGSLARNANTLLSLHGLVLLNHDQNHPEYHQNLGQNTEIILRFPRGSSRVLETFNPSHTEDQTIARNDE